MTFGYWIGILVVAVAIIAYTIQAIQRKKHRQFQQTPQLGDIDGLSTQQDEMETAEDVSSSKPQHDDKILVLYVMASKEQQFMGYELLQVLQNAALHYGKMKIFHRYEEKTGNGEILFSLASSSEPGFFDLDNIGAFSTQGLVLFMDLKKSTSNLAAFELMLNTAEQIATELSGEIHDDHRRLLSDHALEGYQARFNEESILA